MACGETCEALEKEHGSFFMVPGLHLNLTNLVENVVSARVARSKPEINGQILSGDQASNLHGSEDMYKVQ